MTLEGLVTILEGPEAPDQSVRMEPGPPLGHLMWQSKPLSIEAFRRTMVEERRLIYELSIERAYGMQ